MKQNPLLKVQEFGQSLWQDYIQRGLILSGELKQLIDEDGIRGVTSNPSIFDKAIAGSRDYDGDIRAMALEGKSIEQIYRFLTVRDVREAADCFRSLYDRSEGKHGFVSLEVNPHLAHDENGTLQEARELWKALDRPNVFIKVPATREGLICIRRLIAEGINVNVTLLFGLPRYREVAAAYIGGLEDRAAQGKPIDRVSSVASFFLSRIDVLVDQELEKIMEGDTEKAGLSKKCHGEVAIASARQAYQIYKKIFQDERFRKLADQGARPQRLLWASTSTKNPKYSDVKYVEALIGPDTVNTLPQETIKAYRDHGNPAARLEQDLDVAGEVFESLLSLDIDIDKVTQQLEDEGVEKFNKPYDSLMETLEKKRVSVLKEPVDVQWINLAGYGSEVEKQIDNMEKDDFVARLWRKDTALWSADPKDQEVIRKAMGWLHAADKMEENIKELTDFTKEVKNAGFTHVVHMGMGGSSLAPLAFQRTFSQTEHGLRLIVLDTTDPATIADIEKRVPLKQTLFIVASKSGTTAEPLAFMEYFFEKIKAEKNKYAGENFVAITDPETPLTDLAKKRNFRRVFLNFKDIGGRYSALSYFGLVPAALMGIDVAELLVRSLRMKHACESNMSIRENPGIHLGVVLGQLANKGRNKVTFLVPEAISTLGTWLEQLLAESTGKNGTGLIPVALEPVGYPVVYGNDRVFVHIRIKNEIDECLDRSVEQLRTAGQPVVTIEMTDRMDLAQEFFRWEIATATAGAVLGINAFDQPNVQESKDNTNRLLKLVEDKGKLPEEKPNITDGLLSLYSKEDEKITGIADGLIRFLGRKINPGDYIAILAYLTEETATEVILENIRLTLQSKLKIAITMGYGPRYLHSTGQLHKGGPNAGIFLQLTTDASYDMNVPGKPYTFGVFRQAQAQGDLEALYKHGRRALRIHLSGDQGQALLQLIKAMNTALSGVKL
ncbi:MAG: bifunctional transaldolase/phosoglucose isomerase [Desulfobacterales bacterium]|jgi:transaldolase/glucose-6-phosphate isomerase